MLVVDDDDLFAGLITLLLDGRDDVDVVGRARDGLEAVELVTRLHPDVVTMDIEMPRLDGVEATRRVLGADPPPRVVVVSSSLFDDAIAEARRAGAHGFVSKARMHANLADVVVAACRGEAFQGDA